MRPAAGIVGVVVHPFQGVWRSLQTNTGRKQEHQIRDTRISDGREAVRKSTPSQRSEILRKFREAEPGTEARQKRYKEDAEKVLREDAEAERKARGDSKEYVDVKDRPSSSSSRTLSSSSVPPAPQSDADDDAAFERDLELAKQLSLAEQRGYERGLASQFREN